MKNRTHQDILASVLEAAEGTEGIAKTRIMYDSYLSTDQLRWYMTYCQVHGLVSYDEKNRVYKTTIKGVKLLELIAKIHELILIKPIKEISSYLLVVEQITYILVDGSS
jgi:predicted transcriptional regulator